MSSDDTQTPEHSETEGSDSVQVSIPKSFFSGKGGVAGLLALVLGAGTAAGAGSGYITGGLSAEQRLEVITTVQEVRDQIRQDISEVSDEVEEVGDQVTSVENEVAYIRGKLGLVESTLMSEEAPESE